METLEQFFDRHAPHWDSYHKPADFEVIERVFQRIGISDDDCVLDVGAGTGILVPFLRRHGCVKFAAIDISERMVEEYLKKYPIGDVVCGDYQRSGIFPNGQFTKTIIYNTFPHFSDPLSVFRNAYSNLQKDGLLVVFHSKTRHDLNLKHREVGGIVGNHMLIMDDEFRAGLEIAGFRNVIIEDKEHFFASATK